jgi:hypothetical protein
MQQEKNTSWVLWVAGMILFANVLGLWLITIIGQRRVQAVQAEISAIQRGSEATADSPVLKRIAESSQGQSNASMSALQRRVEFLEESLQEFRQATPTPSPKVTATPVPSQTNLKEVWIPLGSGSTTSLDWSTQGSASISVDLSRYPSIKEMYWEAAVSILGGNVSARLITGQNNVISNSEVQHNSSTLTWKRSAALPLPGGTQTFSVQLRSSSGEKAELSNSRLHLIFE